MFPRAIQVARGSYVILSWLAEEQIITAGSLNAFRFPRGHYAYVGSALGGFRARLYRHLRTEKKPRWHIDYLLQKASIDAIITCETEERTECAIAGTLGDRFDCVPGFGSSDCRCRSHLFLTNEEMAPVVMTILNRMGMKPGLWTDLTTDKDS